MATKVASGALTQDVTYLYDGVEPIQDVDTTAQLVRRYVNGAGVDERVQFLKYDTTTGSATGDWEFYTDHQGSVIGMTATNFTWKAKYDEYGKLVSGGNPSPFGYTGRRLDETTGLYYYRARFYNPDIGRFLTTDPIGYKDDMNMYAYVGNDPMNKTDPTGMFDNPAIERRAEQMGLLGRQTIAEVITAKRIGKEYLLKIRGHNNLNDAMRHATWNKKMREQGVSDLVAWTVGFSHEITDILGQPMEEFWMDLNNNREGRAAANEGREINRDNLITSTNKTDNYKEYQSEGTQKPNSQKGVSSLLGRLSSLGITEINFNSNTGIATVSTVQLGSRIPKRTKVKIKED